MNIYDLRVGMVVANVGKLDELYVVSKKKYSSFQLMNCSDGLLSEEFYFSGAWCGSDVLVTKIFVGEI